MSSRYLAQVVHSNRVAVLSRYVRRLLSPPLPGDGLLIVGVAEGIVGWSLSYSVITFGIAPFGVYKTLVSLWVALTAAIVIVGVAFTAPTVRQNTIWLVWGVLNGLAVVVNVTAVAGWFPGPLASVPLSETLLGFGYWRPWFLALGLGYTATALYQWGNPQLRQAERFVYALAGVACLAILSPWVVEPAGLGADLFVLGGLLHVLPMGFDVFADIVLILRRTG